MVAPLCTPEPDCPGFGLETTDSGGGIQILGTSVVIYDSDLHEPLLGDCDLQAGQGQYLQHKSNYKVMTDAERLALAGGAVWNGLEVFCTDTDTKWLRINAAWMILHQILDATTTPALTMTPKQNGSALTKNLNDASALIANGWCRGHTKMQLTQVGTSGTEFLVTATNLPALFDANSGQCIGVYHYSEGGIGGTTHESVVNFDGTDFTFRAAGSTDDWLGESPAFAVAVNDWLEFNYSYRTA